jgi:cell shape-determining protein MreD
MKPFFIFLGVICAFLLQAHLSVLGVSPNLTAAVAYYFGITVGSAKGVFFGSLVGVIEDSVGGHILGPNLLGKGLVGFFSSFMSGSLFRWTPFLGIVSLGILTLMDGGIILLSRAIFEAMPTSLSGGMLTLLVQGFLNGIIGVFIRPRNVE